MPTKHAFASAVVDDADPDMVGPDEWNAYHVTPYLSGEFTVATGNGVVQVDLLQLTGTQLATLEGTAVMVVL
jgi:RecJ-like exonuclease